MEVYQMTQEFPLLNKHFSDLNPLFVGYEHCASGHSYGPAVRDHYLIHYVVCGKGTFYKNNTVYEIQEKEAFLICPGEVITYTADLENPWYYIWIGFDGKWAKQLQELPSPVIKKETTLFHEMLSLPENSNTQPEYLAGKLFLYFSEILDTQKKDDVISRVSDFIELNYMKPLQIEEIAAMVNLERHYLSRIFKEHTKKTMKQFLTEKRMREARRFLQQGYSVKETAMMVGYEDVFVFSKAFKKAVGESPIFYKTK